MANSSNVKKKSKVNYRVLLKSIREYKKPSLIAPLFIAFEVAIEIIIPLLMAKMIDEMTGTSMEPIYKYGSVLIFMAFGSLFFGVMSGRFGATASTGFAKNLRHDLFDKVQEYSFAEIDKFSSSSLITRLTTDVTNVQNAYQMIIRIAVRTPLMFIFAFLMTASISFKMATIFIVVVPVLFLALFLIIKTVFPIFKQIFKKYDKLNNTVQENVSGIRVVKSFVREDYEKDNFNTAVGSLRKDFTKVEKTIALNNPIMRFCVYVTMLLISYIGATTIINSGGSELTTGELSSIIIYTNYILMSVMMLSMIFVMITMSLESINRIVEVLTTDSSLDSNKDGFTDIKDGSIEFKNVNFSYSKEAKKYALNNINLSIKSGETVGILGGTGASKSTLINLIPRLYDTTEGDVFVGGINVKEYNLEALRDNVSVVLQKNVLFSGTIKENLRWGNKDATDEELIEACKIASAHDFIMEFPLGYDTHIERGGTNVSGGQKQRISIARSLLKNPKVIIFDDSTSAVDTKTDARIRAALATQIPDTTKIIIAQRINSVEHADKIIVMENGSVVAIGNHNELMVSSIEYKETYLSQTKSKEVK